MKLTASISKLVASVVALGSLCIFTSTQAADSGQAVVVGVQDGKASYTTDGKTFKSLRPGTKLPVGAKVRTEKGTKVNMKISTDNSVVRVEENSVLGLDKMESEEIAGETVVDSDFDLPDGSILGNVPKIAAASKYQIKTPNGVAGIRGTQYRVSSSGVVSVVSGRVTVTIARQITNQATGVTTTVQVAVTVEAGQTFTPPPMTEAGTATLQAMATAQAQIAAGTAAAAAAPAGSAAAAAAQQQIAAGQQAMATAQATAITQTPATLTVSMTVSIGAATTQVQTSIDLGPTGVVTGQQVETVVPEPEPYVSPTTGG